LISRSMPDTTSRRRQHQHDLAAEEQPLGSPIFRRADHPAVATQRKPMPAPANIRRACRPLLDAPGP